MSSIKWMICTVLTGRSTGSGFDLAWFSFLAYKWLYLWSSWCYMYILKWAGKIVRKMTCIVSSGSLNTTESVTVLQCLGYCRDYYCYYFVLYWDDSNLSKDGSAFAGGLSKMKSVWLQSVSKRLSHARDHAAVDWSWKQLQHAGSVQSSAEAYDPSGHHSQWLGIYWRRTFALFYIIVGIAANCWLGLNSC